MRVITPTVSFLLCVYFVLLYSLPTSISDPLLMLRVV